MPNVLDIRRRIRSVKNTQQITKAMKMVSAAKLRRAQERALAGRPYQEMLTNVLKSLISRVDPIDPKTGEVRHPLLVDRPETTALAIVVTGDRGLAGAFNTNINKAALRLIQTRRAKSMDIVAVGRKGRDFLRRRFPTVEAGAGRKGEVQISGELVGIMNRVEFSHADKLARSAIERYVHGEVDAVYLLFNEFKSVISQQVVAQRILPVHRIESREVVLTEAPSETARREAAVAAARTGVSLREADTSQIEAEAAQFATKDVEYIYEQPPGRLFADLLPRFVATQIYRALLESVAAEHAARMTAMESATNNASEMIDALTLAMNRARQAKITKEIIEIVSGAAAL